MPPDMHEKKGAVGPVRMTEKYRFDCRHKSKKYSRFVTVFKLDKKRNAGSMKHKKR